MSKHKNIKLLFSRITLRFDLRCLNFSFFIPTFFVVGVLLLFIALKMFGTFEYRYLCNSIEIVLPLGGAWYSIFITRTILEYGDCELYFSYDISRIYLGLLRVFRGYALYIIQITIMLITVYFIYLVPLENMLGLALLTFIQTLFFSGLGFLITVVSKDSFIGLVGCSAYAIFYLFTKGEYINDFCLYQFWEYPISIREYPLGLIFRDLIYVSVLFFLGQWVFNHTKATENRQDH